MSDINAVDMNQLNSKHFVDRLVGLLTEFPCRGRRLVLASPTYGHADPSCQKNLRVAMMVAANYGCVWVGDASPERMGFSAGRNTVAQNVVDDAELGEDDGIMWVDSDIRMPPNAIAKLIYASVTLKIDFITGVYYQRGFPFAPLFFHFNKQKKKFQSYESVPDNTVGQCEGCGFGFVYTSKRALITMAKHRDFRKSRGWFPDDSTNGGFSEDLNFSYQAMNAGVQLWAHTGVTLGHLGDPEVITGDKWADARKQIPAVNLFVKEDDRADE